ncbi:unnamed protein product [Blepharisma stoltei]|uniref:Uncharacterized protein n=1 Tax=Blepharisma stoltei TaxID=1481888 RepID=A0AAU9KNT5_9CILI|nr:unnamed protein product [Blepharisma stoltei]
MSRYIVDILSSAANLEDIPRCSNIILLVPDTFRPSREIESQFTSCQNIDQALTGGSLYIKISSEFERGLIIGLILGRWPDAKLLTSRQGVYQKLSQRINLQKYRESSSENCHTESCGSTEASSVYANSPREERKINFPPQKPVVAPQLTAQDRYLDNLYYEVLNKFYDKFLIEVEIRAPKKKSVQAQLKNFAEGAIISVKKKAVPGITDTLPGSLELSMMVYDDLVSHKVIEESGLNVFYNDLLINEYFGREKSREFKPMYKEARNQRPPSPPPPPSPPSKPVFDKQSAVDAAFKLMWRLIWTDIYEGNPEDIGDLVIIIDKRFDKYQAEEPEMFPNCIKDDIIKRAIKLLFKNETISLLSNSQKNPEFISENYKTNRKEKILTQ